MPYDTAPAAADAPAPASTEEPVDLLLVAAAGGCVRSFERCYQLTSRRLFAIVLRINGDPGEAEELLQDIYIRIWQECARFDARQGAAMHWLASIARHRAIDSLRRRATRPTRSHFMDADPDADPYEGLAAATPQPADRLIDHQRATVLLGCIGALPQGARESVTLAFYAGLSYSEIAQRLNRPIGTVKTWMRRSLLTMRAELAGADL